MLVLFLLISSGNTLSYLTGDRELPITDPLILDQWKKQQKNKVIEYVIHTLYQLLSHLQYVPTVV